MNISNVLVSLTGSDILSIINDFVKVDGLLLDEVVIDENILIRGSFTKIIKIKFEVTLDNLKVVDGKVNGRFSKLKVYKLGMIRMIRSLLLKSLLNIFGDIGIEENRDELVVNVDDLLKGVPFLKINVEEIYLKDKMINANVKNVDINVSKINLNKENEEEIEDSVIDEKNIDNTISEEELLLVENKGLNEKIENEFIEEDEIIENKTEDYYSKGREEVKEKLDNKLPEKAKDYSEYLFLIPDLLALILRLLKDNRVPIKTKLSVSASIAYIVCPTDMIPSNIPFIGKIDDLAVLFFALNRISKDVPLKVLLENWSGKVELILVLRSGLEYVTNFTGARNIEKIYSVVEELSTL
ncbi:YkvA family protein [Clostridium sp. Ade.TY]|uniref:YkvA family protein n=1 Tax=Clostridium sp. Ade.TY TaxID=1391647 RepID=UPI00042345D7|nr:YkvA family protein [Clostridium sp. Ade.TY]